MVETAPVQEREAEVSVRAPRYRFHFAVAVFFRPREGVTPPHVRVVAVTVRVRDNAGARVRAFFIIKLP